MIFPRKPRFLMWSSQLAMFEDPGDIRGLSDHPVRFPGPPSTSPSASIHCELLAKVGHGGTIDSSTIMQ